jgi:hypothetical protein
MTSGKRMSIARLIFVPSAITLAVTLLRLIGELQHWSPVLFNPAPGGGGAIMGITWLVLIFGVYSCLSPEKDRLASVRPPCLLSSGSSL